MTKKQKDFLAFIGVMILVLLLFLAVLLGGKKVR
jgi:hypothetical protein